MLRIQIFPRLILPATIFCINILHAQTEVNLLPIKDNTLYESPTGALSNGAGAFLFVAQTNHADARRTLVAFDITGNIPANALIQSAVLTLNMSRAFNANAQTVTLHRLLADWGEGASDAGGEEGGGINAASGDATWIHTFFNTQRWSAPGGDFSPSPRASRAVGAIGSYSWGSTPEMVADVQAWLNTPSSNFGWMLLSNEIMNGSAKRFDSRQNTTTANRPVLKILYATSSGVAEQAGAYPLRFDLAQNYPNPFNPSTIIRYELPEAAFTKVVIYNLEGKPVRTLVHAHESPGYKHTVWDGRDDAGDQVASGVYIYRLETEVFHATRKLTLMR